MTKKKTPDMPFEKPVIYVHAKGHSPVSRAQIRSLSELGLPVLSRLQVDGAVQTKNGYDQALALLAELAKKFPGRPVIFLRAGILPSAKLLGQLTLLVRRAEGPVAFSVLSNAVAAVNPFAGVEKPPKKTDYKLEDLVSLLAPGQIHELAEWVDHFVLISAAAVELMTGKADQRSLMQQLSAIGGKLQLPDYLFIEDPGKAAFERLKLQSYESPYPPPFGELSTRIQSWVNAEISALPDTSQPPTLHITHSWGGGVAQWIRSFIKTDQDHTHFQLRSEIAESNQAYGQKLALYAGNELRCPIASWWLQPPIESVTASNQSYERILTEICDRFQVCRVIVSSLIGHDLCVFETGLPTLQILHDHFPLWPMLEADPEPYISAKTGVNLRKAFKESRKSQLFRDKDASAWVRLNKTYLHNLKRSNVKIAAPGQWVLDLQNRLKPGFAKLETTIIPHGIPDSGKPRLINPRPRSDARLRIVILGRMQEGKGRELLLQALPGLVNYAQVYLLGTGKAGEEFFGISGVDVVLEYEPDELTDLLSEIGPHFAALLSIVPETFSYTLSELQKLGIPAIATRIGSFPDRISHGETGWLVDLDPASLVDQVVAICRNHDEINKVRKNLLNSTSNSMVEMVAAYNRFCPPAETVQSFTPGSFDLYQAQWAAADYQQTLTDNALSAANEKNRKATQWALEERESAHAWEKEAKRITGEFEAKAAWALQLNQLVDQLEIEVSTYKGRLRQSESDLGAKLDELEQTQLYLEDLSGQLDKLLQSKSWRITRPLRVLRRVAATFMQARAWNPLRWPWLFASLFRNFHTLGFKGTLLRIQKNQADETADSTPAVTQTPDLVSNSYLQTPAESGIEIESGNQPEPVEEPAIPGPFTHFEHPDVSIVIPVYNNWAYTTACLSSLLRVKNSYSFEVIVVDDQSSDVSQERLQSIDGLVYLRNEQNLGFVASCNRGAQQARGEYLVLLNNDTQVTDGWLDELIDTFDMEPGIGMVGSRLVYPNGKQQESGGIIFNDASGWNYGREDVAERPEYHFVREVDYCSGACIALKTRYFNDLGGLDERYSPAYYEDTDLAFKVRESGKKVMLQPWSVVIHHEGVTSGTDTSSGTKRYQLINQEKFLEN
jgi:GT2 family glycosyltransferase/glycosyltransferase involved in cell wall biosynthesis